MRKNYDATVSIERPSKTPSNTYRTMNAIDITHLTAPLDDYLYPNIY